MFEAFKVGIKISLVNEVSAGLALISKHLLSTHKDAEKLEATLGRIKGMWTAGGIAAGVGFGMLYSLKGPIDQAAKFQHQLVQLNTLGMTQQEIAIATAAAWKTSHEVMTSTAAENMQMFRELRSAFKGGLDSTREIAAVLPVVQRIQAVLDSVSGKHQEGVGFDMIKAIELRSKGPLDYSSITQQAGMMGKTLMAFGGTLNVHDYHMAIKQAKESGSVLSDDFVYNYLPTLMQEVKTGEGGAQQAGTILRTMNRAVIGGHMQKSSIPYWVEAGLINQRDIIKNSTGAWQVRPGSVKNSAEYEQNPFGWAVDTLMGAEQRLMDKHHWSQQQANSALFSDRNAAFGFFNMIVRQSAYTANKDKIASADNVYSAYQKLAASDPEMAEQMLHAQWENLLAKIGFTILPKLIPLIDRLANGLMHMGDWIDEHKNMMTDLVYGFATLGAVLTVGGTLAMGAGLISILGTTGIAIVALGATFVAFSTIANHLVDSLSAKTPHEEQDEYIKNAIWGRDTRKHQGEWFDPITQRFYPLALTSLGGVDEDATITAYRKLHPYAGSNSVPPVHGAPGGQVNTQVDVHLDGEKIATHVIRKISKSSPAPAGGLSFNGADMFGGPVPFATN